MSKRTYFGTDGIRGRVGQWPITAEFMLKLGRAAGKVLTGPDGDATVVIGKDTRISGYMFESALEAGLVAAGANVRLLGPMPTPAVAYLTRSLRASAGIVISASHNPHQDNGIKFFSADGEKLADDVEAAIERELEAPFETVPSEQIGKAVRVSDAATRYGEFCNSTFPHDLSLRSLKLVVDCAHGATYQIAPKLFEELGARVSSIGTQPDGLNINRDCGSTSPAALQRAVVEQGADLGIAFDGDGDRVLFVDAGGRLVDGDDILYVLASDWQRSGRLSGPVVGTLMTNYGLERAFAAAGIGFLRAKVGDRYVMQALKETAGMLGGEASGHILCLDSASTGDGIVAALQLLEVLVRNGQTLAQACTGWERLPQITRNVRVSGNAGRLLEHVQVLAERSVVERELEGRGRLVLRASGTEPLIRVTIEAADAALVDALAGRLARAVESAATESA
ncbi:phosphoglucosamine mutase [Tahibacter aquaticus]|uniref:Phosphoglucosamine mutase n=1 Tax=Tahibacter aquaticus TaxID=520092 RepID=A0A4R6YNZ8_9GAMM|nr:phosphoglucosamine mutase [Tahibacter aquaticus]TDR39441.1 phosphoglucosamine mutase [Tahibacter aquaticus]